MAGETLRSASLTLTDSGLGPAARQARGKVVRAMDVDALATTELEVGDVVLLDIKIPSNAIVTGVFMYNDDLDGATSLVLDIGLFAAADFTEETSSTATKHLENAVLDADVYVDGDTTGRAATTKWTRLAFDSATKGPDDAAKAAWEDLGYDFDPRTEFRFGITVSAAAGTPQAGDLGIMVEYMVD
jgi:hypothetical protein